MFFGVHQRFWQQPNLIAFAFCGVGAAALAQHVSNRVTAAAHKATPPTWLAAATCGVVLALVAWQLRAAHPKADMANDEYGDGVGQGVVLVMPSKLTVDIELVVTVCRYIEQYGHAVLASVPEGSIIISADDLKVC